MTTAHAALVTTASRLVGTRVSRKNSTRDTVRSGSLAAMSSVPLVTVSQTAGSTGATHRIAVIALQARSSRLADTRALVPQVLEVLAQVRAATLMVAS